MAVWSRVAVVLSLLGLLMAVGCQQAAERPVVRPLAQSVPPLADSGVAEGVMSAFVTATPWPTFTPVPAPRADLLPAVAPIVAATPLPAVAAVRRRRRLRFRLLLRLLRRPFCLQWM